MCIIIAKPGKKKLPKAIYEESFRVNKDGGGFAYILNHSIVVEKGFFKFEEFYKAIQEVENLPLLIHCRIKSDGPINIANCHPFVFRPKDSPYEWVMAHNGVLAWRSTNKQSDTACFAEDFLWPLLERDPEFLDDACRQIMLQRMINDRNKMVIIRYNKEKNVYDQYIINKSAGEMNYGCWMSNASWRPWKGGYTGGYSGGYAGNMGGHGYTGDDGENFTQRPSINHRVSFPKPTHAATKVHDHVADSLEIYGWKRNHYGVWINPTLLKAVMNGKEEKFGIEALEHLKPKDWKPSEAVGKQLKLLDGGGKEIEVPRDELDDEAVNKLVHLGKDQRKKLRRFAADYLKATNVDMKGMSDMEKIKMLRDAMKERCPAWKQLEDKALDLEILKEDPDVTITVVRQEIADEILNEERTARELAKAQAGNQS